jgi:monoamine oxidase
MQNMDMSTLKLDYNKTFAIRKLQYDPAGKIGMTFKTRWWESPQKDSTKGFQGGQ